MTAGHDELETGDRARFVARLRERLAGGVPENVAHPLPPAADTVPAVVSTMLDPDDLVGSFVRNATDACAAVHQFDGDVSDDFLRELVSRHGVQRAVTSAEPEAVAVGRKLAAWGVTVDAMSVDASAAADLGITSAVAAIATTGTVVQDSTVAGGRTASLLPPVHLCVVPVERVVASSADVLRRLGDGRRLPSNLVLVTGPSRSGDIEQIMALGVHGPIAVEIALVHGVDR